MTVNLEDVQKRMAKSIDAFQHELQNFRAGRANPNILNNVAVDYFDTPTPLNQLASISVPEARVLLITPFDINILEDIEKAIYTSDLGLTPNNDGASIRLTIPPLTEESRKELAKEVGVESEKAKVSVRNVRRDAMDDVKKDDDYTEDTRRTAEAAVQKLTDESIKEIDKIAADKEKELLTI